MDGGGVGNGRIPLLAALVNWPLLGPLKEESFARMTFALVWELQGVSMYVNANRSVMELFECVVEMLIREVNWSISHLSRVCKLRPMTVLLNLKFKKIFRKLSWGFLSGTTSISAYVHFPCHVGFPEDMHVALAS